MRILLLFNRPIEATIKTSGVSEFIKLLPPALKAVGTESLVYTSGSSRELIGPTTPMSNGTLCYEGPYAKPAWFVSKKNILPLAEFCKKEKIQVVHAQGTYRSGFMAMELHKLTGIPYVITSHGDIAPVNSERMNRKKILRRCQKILQHAAAVTHLTPAMAEISHQIYDTKNKSTIIANGIDVSDWPPYQNLAEKNYLLTIGRLIPEKGFHILIDAYAKLHQKGIQTSLVIAGTGPFENELQRQAKQLGLAENVIFTGYISGDEKKRLIAESQAILFAPQPAIWEEAFGLVQLEAMAAGKPLIASDTAATRYLHTLGLQTSFARPDDTNDWAEKITQLLLDPILRKKMGMINKENVHQFDWKNIANQYQDVYQLCSGT